MSATILDSSLLGDGLVTEQESIVADNQTPQSNQSSAYADMYANTPPPRRCLLTLTVMVLTTCLCATTISMSGLAGYQDEARTVRTEKAQTRVAEVATQYQLAIEDETAGLDEFARDRYEYILTEQPGYLDAETRLIQANMRLSYTPTPLPPTATLTPSPEPDTPIPTITPTEAEPLATATRDPFNVEDAFSAAYAYSISGLHEDAIERLNIVIQIDPTYRRAEVDKMLFEALKSQAVLYFRALNTGSGETGFEGDQLARGVQLANQAISIYEANPNVGTLTLGGGGTLTGERNFVQGYMTGRDFVYGGRYADALPILENLCTINCGWSYGGVTVQSLLDRARSGN